MKKKIEKKDSKTDIVFILAYKPKQFFLFSRKM